tara:strand:- start:172 stop:375 length:204 start_codon:yes stop_codon:yes gene_type:complete
MDVYIRTRPNYLTSENEIVVEVTGLDSYGDSVSEYDIITREMLLEVLGENPPARGCVSITKEKRHDT